MRHCEVKQPMYYRILRSIRVRKRGETIIQINNEQKHHKYGKKKKGNPDSKKHMQKTDRNLEYSLENST